MERITKVQVKIAQGLERGGGLILADVAKQYGANNSNAKAALHLMRSKGYVNVLNGRYHLTFRGRDLIFKSNAAKELNRVKHKTKEPFTLPLPFAPEPTKAEWTSGPTSLKKAIMVSFGSHKDFPLSEEDARGLHDILAIYFKER